ncbi:uncharacterized protein K02A2.6-like [Musca vetustissima]|uniref:uncharacterized protein K02A2.6-like n=1 Tax=Musca vetustissima TaxID=27455 RepID=UPI002AB60FA0|nr:uncharacterized protein K02A2.6-like [Musca vetustissima]
MKAIARSYFWWPGLDKEIELKARMCEECCQQSKHPPAADAKSWPLTLKPWSRIHIDYAGPFIGTNFLIVVDSHSKWLEVKATADTTSTKTIELLRDIFASHGLPDIVVTDNGRNFKSSEFETFLKENGIRHFCTAPYHPSSNGQAERFVQSVKSHLKKLPPTNIAKNLANILLRLRTTPNPISNISPAEILMGREIKTLLDIIYPATEENRKKGTEDESSGKTRPVRSFEIGDTVCYRNFGKGEKWLPGVVQSTGDRNYEITTGHDFHSRHIDQLRSRVPLIPTQIPEDNTVSINAAPAPPEHQTSPQNSNEEIIPNTATVEVSQPTSLTVGTPGRPQRQRRAPQRYGDYLMGEEPVTY